MVMKELFPARMGMATIQEATPAIQVLDDYFHKFCEMRNSDALADFVEITCEMDAGRIIYRLPRYTVQQGGSKRWRKSGNPDEQPYEITGVPLFWIAEYQSYAPERNDNDMPMTQCASWNFQVGHGNPGGDCEICPHQQRNYFGRRKAHADNRPAYFEGKPDSFRLPAEVDDKGKPSLCNIRSRIILATLDSELPVVLDITGAASKKLTSFHRTDKNKKLSGVYKFTLVPSEKYQEKNNSTSEAIATQVGVIAGIDNEVLAEMQYAWEQFFTQASIAWAQNVERWNDNGASRYQLTGSRPVLAPASNTGWDDLADDDELPF